MELQRADAAGSYSRRLLETLEAAYHTAVDQYDEVAKELDEARYGGCRTLGPSVRSCTACLSVRVCGLCSLAVEEMRVFTGEFTLWDLGIGSWDASVGL